MVFSLNYMEGLEAYFVSDQLRLKKIIAKTENSNEKKLLKVRLLMDQSKMTEAENLCQSVSPYPRQFNGEKAYLLSMIYFTRRLYEKSTACGLEALEVFLEFKNQEKLFKIYHNLSVNYTEMRWYDVGIHYLEKAKEYARDIDDELLILRAKACLLSQANNFPKALETLDEINSRLNESRKFEYEAYYLVAGDICAWAGEYNMALDYFQKIKHRQNFQSRERLVCHQSFLKAFLLEKEASLLPKMPSFFHPSSEFATQWDFLGSMQSGDLQKAQGYWKRLQELRPLVYGTKFESVSETEKRNIFFQCVDKLRPASQNLQPLSNLTGHLQRAYDIFISSPIPLRKEELIEKIWQVPYSTDFDSRFYKLMERLKTKVSARVVQRNRAYLLEPAAN